ncbi:GH1 family beta-glucosidase [Novosphingobium aquae]|uniref:Beta-glucosidase n=1 Tax=Novosphingobium aquae TaxID=3133435 RepID=A0ABU8SA20_9SPHN
MTGSNFLWGVSTSAYQIEGASEADGRGQSIWDEFTALPGVVANGDTGAVACDHYNRWPEDIGLMEQLGIGAYRFSLSWPRLFPEGVGQPNERGAEFYDRLIDALLERGIDPWICLYHWDLPQALQDRGGWANRDVANWYADYARFVADRFGDRAKAFITFNEPSVFTLSGYGGGLHAPGVKESSAMLAAIHNVCRAHHAALPALRSTGVPTGIVGAFWPMRPERPEDEGGAMMMDMMFNWACPDAMVAGSYPPPMEMLLGDVIQAGDLPSVGTWTDFIGVNHYAPMYIRTNEAGEQEIGAPPADVPLTGMGWHIDPPAFTAMLQTVAERYPDVPLYVTENGIGLDEGDEPDALNDIARVQYLHDYLAALADARAAGVGVQGYFAWSLLDNFEWAEGFAKRFGLVRVEPDNLARRPKQSFFAYRDLIKGGIPKRNT